jgi:hypothetical protein
MLPVAATRHLVPWPHGPSHFLCVCPLIPGDTVGDRRVLRQRLLQVGARQMRWALHTILQLQPLWLLRWWGALLVLQVMLHTLQTLLVLLRR